MVQYRAILTMADQ